MISGNNYNSFIFVIIADDCIKLNLVPQKREDRLNCFIDSNFNEIKKDWGEEKKKVANLIDG